MTCAGNAATQDATTSQGPAAVVSVSLKEAYGLVSSAPRDPPLGNSPARRRSSTPPWWHVCRPAGSSPVVHRQSSTPGHATGTTLGL